MSQKSVPGLISRLRPGVRLVLGLALGLCLGGAVGAAYGVYQLWRVLPDVNHLADYEPMLPMRVYARDGSLLAEYGEERREVVPIDRMPLKLRQALLAIEDADYYTHGAVDFTGLVRAAVSNVAAGHHAQGGSTITMQVARVFFLSREKTYRRKMMEILLAYKLESVYSKDKILELYMNQVYLGERAYGFAAAASVYFTKTLDELTVAEAAMLAGLPKAPSAYNPVVNRDRAITRQQHILKRMRELGHIDEQAYQQARAEKLALRQQYRSMDPAAAYAVEQARKLVVDRYGDDAYALGLDVITTISVGEQHAATRALRTGLVNAQGMQPYGGPEGRVEQVPAIGDRLGIRAALASHRDSGDLRAAIVLQASASTGITAALRDGTSVFIPSKKLGRSAIAALRPETLARNRITPGSVIRATHDDVKGWSLSQLPQMEGALVSVDVHSGE